MQLPRRAIGPHTIASFATEWRAYTFTVWGSSYQEGAEHLQEAGWLPEMERDLEGGVRKTPRSTDGLYHGPSRGHADEEHAQLIGMPRGYGYGASMGAWVLDYVADWAGDDGFVRHSNVQYRFPAFDGDVTYLDAEVTGTRYDETLGASLVTLEVVMTNAGRGGDGQGSGRGAAARVARGTGRRSHDHLPGSAARDRSRDRRAHPGRLPRSR